MSLCLGPGCLAHPATEKERGGIRWFLRSLSARGVCDRAADLLLVWQVRQRLAGPRAQQGGLAGSPQVASPDAKPWSPGPERTDLEPFSGIRVPRARRARREWARAQAPRPGLGRRRGTQAKSPQTVKPSSPFHPQNFLPGFTTPAATHWLSRGRPDPPSLFRYWLEWASITSRGFLMDYGFCQSR